MLLVVFALGITPKVFLHKLIAGHKDLAYTCHGTTDQFTKAGFRCNCDNQVVQVPYIHQIVAILLVVPICFPTDQITADHSFPCSPHLIFGLRGPPSRA